MTRRFEKSQLVGSLPRKKKVDFRLLTGAMRQMLHVVVVVVGEQMEKSA